jgi:stress response protein YsnF
MTNAQDTLQVVDEFSTVRKQDVVTGKVRVSTKTELVDEVVSAMLDRQDVEVSRVPRGIEITGAPEIRTEGDVTIVPIVEEILVVEKRLVLKEELHLRRSVSSEHVELPVTLRKQRAVIERSETDEPNFEEEK